MKYRKLYYSIKYTRFNQLVYRLKYIVRRQMRSEFPGIFRNYLGNINFSEYKVNDNLPSAVMFPRSGMLKKINSDFELRFLNHSRKFSFPVNWHPPELAYGTRLWKLHLHYMEYLEEVDDKLFEAIVSDWIKNNPPYMKDYGLDNWNSYALSIRIVIWMQQYALRKKAFQTGFVNTIITSIIQQIYFLEKNLELDIGGNHLIKNVKALFWAGKFFSNGRSKVWKETAEHILSSQLDEQILKDGMHFELSPAYHCQVFVDLLECFTVLENQILKQKLFNTLKMMAQVIANFTHPDGTISLFNDGGLNMTYSPVECLNAWEKISGKKFITEKIFTYPESGYYGMHNHDLYFIVDAGRIGPDYLPAHSHGDIFSFELSYKGKRFIIDPGVYEYNAGKKRDYSRATSSHNTVNLDGLDQCEFYGSFRVGRRADVIVDKFIKTEEGFVLSAFHYGYMHLEGAPEIKRTIEFHKNKIIISDDVIGGAGQKAEARILLHPGCVIGKNENEIIISRDDDELIITSSSNSSIEPASWYPDFGKELKTNQLIFYYGDSPCSSEIIIHLGSDENKLFQAEEEISQSR